MRWTSVHDLYHCLAEEKNAYFSSMHSLASMSFQDSVEKGRRLLGKLGMSGRCSVSS